MNYKYCRLLSPWLIALSLLSGTTDCSKVPFSVVKYESKTLKSEETFQQEPSQIASEVSNAVLFSLNSLGLIGSVSCTEDMQQRKGITTWILNYLATTTATQQGEGRWGIVGLKANKEIDHKLISIRARACKDQIKKLLWEGDDMFIFWGGSDDISKHTFILEADPSDYSKLTDSSYDIYVIYMSKEASTVHYTYQPKTINFSLPNYKEIGLTALQASSCHTKQSSDEPKWILQGHAQRDAMAGTGREQHIYSKDIHVGFVLADAHVNPYKMMQQFASSKTPWPTQLELFKADDQTMVIVPGNVHINGQTVEIENDGFSNDNTLIPKGMFRSFCVVSWRNHFYISQLEHIEGGNRYVPEGSITTCAPPSLTFPANIDIVHPDNLKIDFGKTETGFIYSVEHAHLKENSTDHLKAGLLLFKSDAIWRVADVETLFKRLQTAHGAVALGDLCLIVDDIQEITDTDGISFFSDMPDCRFAKFSSAICLYESDKGKLQHYRLNPGELCPTQPSGTIPSKGEAEPAIDTCPCKCFCPSEQACDCSDKDCRCNAPCGEDCICTKEEEVEKKSFWQRLFG